MSNVFLLSPVFRVSDELRNAVGRYVATLESRGHTVYWPLRDGKKDDRSGGLETALQNREAMVGADEVHVWYDDTSAGSCFDVGMAWAMKFFEELNGRPTKKILLVNKETFYAGSDTYFHHFVGRLTGEEVPERRVPNVVTDELVQVYQFPGVVLGNDLIQLHFNQRESTHLMRLGIIVACMREHPIRLRSGLPKTATWTEKRSFNNVFLSLIEHTRERSKTI